MLKEVEKMNTQNDSPPVVMERIHQWLRHKRVCAWCKCRLGGNLFAKDETHGICPLCKDTVLKGIA